MEESECTALASECFSESPKATEPSPTLTLRSVVSQDFVLASIAPAPVLRRSQRPVSAKRLLPSSRRFLDAKSPTGSWLSRQDLSCRRAIEMSSCCRASCHFFLHGQEVRYAWQDARSCGSFSGHPREQCIMFHVLSLRQRARLTDR